MVTAGWENYQRCSYTFLLEVTIVVKYVTIFSLIKRQKYTAFCSPSADSASLMGVVWNDYGVPTNTQSSHSYIELSLPSLQKTKTEKKRMPFLLGREIYWVLCESSSYITIKFILKTFQKGRGGKEEEERERSVMENRNYSVHIISSFFSLFLNIMCPKS